LLCKVIAAGDSDADKKQFEPKWRDIIDKQPRVPEDQSGAEEAVLQRKPRSTFPDMFHVL